MLKLSIAVPSINVVGILCRALLINPLNFGVLLKLVAFVWLNLSLPCQYNEYNVRLNKSINERLPLCLSSVWCYCIHRTRESVVIHAHLTLFCQFGKYRYGLAWGTFSLLSNTRCKCRYF